MKPITIHLTAVEAAIVEEAALKSGRTRNGWVEDAVRGSVVLYDQLGGQPAERERVIR